VDAPLRIGTRRTGDRATLVLGGELDCARIPRFGPSSTRSNATLRR
jgi:hypothetical protein